MAMQAKYGHQGGEGDRTNWKVTGLLCAEGSTLRGCQTGLMDKERPEKLGLGTRVVVYVCVCVNLGVRVYGV